MFHKKPSSNIRLRASQAFSVQNNEKLENEDIQVVRTTRLLNPTTIQNSSRIMQRYGSQGKVLDSSVNISQDSITILRDDADNHI
jgi:hypothetical protein